MIGSAILITQLVCSFLYSFKYPESNALLIINAALFVVMLVYSISAGMTRRLADAYATIFVLSAITTGLCGKDFIAAILLFLTALFLILFPFPANKTKNKEKTKRKSGKKKQEELRPRTHINPYNLTPSEFNKLMIEILEKFGYKIEKVLNSQENGLDLITRGIKNKKIIVMIRRYKGLISTKLLQRLFEIMLEENADGGIFITTSDFSASSYRLSESKPIRLINGKELNELSKDLLKVEFEI